jgi:TolA-binding protein
MNKRRSGEAISPISLFPFLSVLSCVIGTLTLMIAVVALTGMADNPHYRAEKMNRLQHELTAADKEVERLKEAIAQELQGKRRMAELGRRITSLQSQIDNFVNKNDKLASLTKELAELNQRIKQREQERKLAERKSTNLELEVKDQKRKQDFEKKFIPIQILPRGKGDSRARAWFAECGRSKLTLYRNAQDSIEISFSQLKRSKRFRGFLDEIRRMPDGLLIFLIRAMGIQTFDVASEIAEKQNVKFGKLAVPWTGPLELSSFYQQKERADR